MKTENNQPTAARILGRLALRTFLYALLLGALAYGMLWGAVSQGASFYDEVGAVEILQMVFTLMAAGLFLEAGRINEGRRPFTIVISGFLFCLFIRESDYFLDELVARHAWKMIVLLTVILVAVYVIKNAGRVLASVLDFLCQPSFGVFMSALLIVLVFSRLFGYGDFWEALIEGGYYRVIKTIAEEGTELLGYALLFISSCEYLHAARMTQDGRGAALEE